MFIYKKVDIAEELRDLKGSSMRTGKQSAPGYLCPLYPAKEKECSGQKGRKGGKTLNDGHKSNILCPLPYGPSASNGKGGMGKGGQKGKLRQEMKGHKKNLAPWLQGKAGGNYSVQQSKTPDGVWITAPPNGVKIRTVKGAPSGLGEKYPLANNMRFVGKGLGKLNMKGQDPGFGHRTVNHLKVIKQITKKQHVISRNGVSKTDVEEDKWKDADYGDLSSWPMRDDNDADAGDEEDADDQDLMEEEIQYDE